MVRFEDPGAGGSLRWGLFVCWEEVEGWVGLGDEDNWGEVAYI